MRKTEAERAYERFKAAEAAYKLAQEEFEAARSRLHQARDERNVAEYEYQRAWGIA